MKLKTLKIGDKMLKNNVFIAPMAGFTDKAFRSLCLSLGAGFVVTEMVSAKGLIYKNDHTRELLSSGDDIDFTAAQIFGGEPAFLAEGAVIALALSGADILDLNMGCPAGKIVKSGEGSALMKDLRRAAAQISDQIRCFFDDRRVNVQNMNQRIVDNVNDTK